MSEPVNSNPEPVQVLAPTALESISRAEVDMQIATAKRFPRDVSAVKNKIEQLATLDEETAEQCFYVLERDGKTIEGPSVRLAEIAMVCYQNIKAGYRPMANDGRKVTAQGVCYDLENNVAITVEKSRKITKRDGTPFSEDMQIVTMNAAGAIAFRDAVFKVVPQVLVKPAMEKAKQVALGKAESLTKRRAAIIERLRHFCPNEERILSVVRRTKVDELDQADLLKLMGLATALKDGEVTVEEAFPVVRNPIEEPKARGRKGKAPEAPPAPPTPAAARGEESQDDTAEREALLKKIKELRRSSTKTFAEVAKNLGIDTETQNYEEATTDVLRILLTDLRKAVSERVGR